MQTIFLFHSTQLIILTVVALLGTLPTVALQTTLGASSQFSPKTSQAIDDRGSGRILPQLVITAFPGPLNLLAFRGSGRLGTDDEQPEKSSLKTTPSVERASTYSYRGTGRISRLQVSWA
ncbi:MAG TPA: hypothetical protein V6D29_18930 [Leptolyngbyaceae cyanobacterium]